MSTITSTAKARARQRCYIDRALQGPLLIGLVIFEAALFALALAALHHNMTVAMEQQIYRAHQLPTTNLDLLIRELLWVGAWVVGINIAAVALMNRLWNGMIGRITTPLQRLLAAVEKLDLRPRVELCDGHAVLRQADEWLHHERARNEKIHELVQQLDAGADADRTREILQELHQTLNTTRQAPVRAEPNTAPR